MLNTKIGIEVEFTGITRNKASKIVAEHLNGRIEILNDHYNTHKVIAEDGRVWKVMSDGSIRTQKKENGIKTTATSSYSVELVSPILKYTQDIEMFQELIRKIRKAGAFTNDTCGIHIHLDGKGHNAKSIRNFVNIIASKNDLFYKALQIKQQRMTYCKKMDARLVEKINKAKPTELNQIEDIWYEGYYNRTNHYNNTRYHFLNLHSFFHGHKTVELRGFNSELHAGKIRSYIILALALNNQALTQKQTSSKKPQTQNERFAMRTYLNRIGLVGDDYKNCREHLTSALNGSSAWRHNAPSLA